MKTREEMACWAVYLGGIGFPVDRATLLEWAERSAAPAALLRELRSLPDGTYSTVADVGREIGKLGRRREARPVT